MMTQNELMILGQEGITYFEKDHVDPYWGTKSFVTLPDGRTLAEYDHITLIPNWLNNDDEFTMKRTGGPVELCNTSDWEADLWGFDESMNLTDGALILPAYIGYAFWVIISSILFMGFYFIISLILRPCGEGHTETLNECWKVIIYPDCKYASFNGCEGPDNNGDGYPDGVLSPPEGGFELDWMTGLIIGAVVIGGVIIAVKVLPGLLKKEEKKAAVK